MYLNLNLIVLIFSCKEMELEWSGCVVAAVRNKVGPGKVVFYYGSQL